MGKRERKPLFLKNNYPVRTLEELQEHFDLQKIKEYYANDQLLQWLNERYYEEQAKRIANLKETGLNLDAELYSIFEIDSKEISQTSYGETTWQPCNEPERKVQEGIKQNTKKETTQQSKEEAKRKIWEAAAQKSREEAKVRRAKEEALLKAQEGAKYKAKEEERRVQEETERKIREEAKYKAKEEAEYKIREEARRLAKETERKNTGLLFANCCIIGGFLAFFMLPLSFISIVVAVISIIAGVCSKNLISAKRATLGILFSSLILIYQIIGNIFTSSSNQTLVADVKMTETISENTLSEIPLSTTENTPTEKATIQETTIPETTALETTTQATTAPETTVPTTVTSETTAPETTVPETTVPETSIQETESQQINSNKIVGNQYVLKEYNSTAKLTINNMYFTRNLESIGLYDYLPEDSTAFIIEYTVNKVNGYFSDTGVYKDSVALRADNNYTWYHYSQSLTDALLEINNFESYFHQIDENTYQYILAFMIPNEYTAGDFPLVLNLYGNTAIEFSASVVNVIP